MQKETLLALFSSHSR